MVTQRVLYGRVRDQRVCRERAFAFADWQDRFDPVTAARVDTCIRRLESGNFGAAKYLRGGVSELRLDFGPGYRVYYGLDGKTLVILLGGGDKRRQSADIEAAVRRWETYLKGR